MIRVIVAYTRIGRVIGRSGQLPWKRLSGDLPRFKALTMGHTVVMGRRTFESIGKSLPGRQNVVITRQNLESEGVTFVPDFLSAIRASNSDVDVIGGEQIYREAFKSGLVEEVIATEIEKEFKGDTYFPELPGKWSRGVLEECSGYSVVSYKINSGV